MSDEEINVQKKFHVGSWWVTPGQNPSVGKVVSVLKEGKSVMVKLQLSQGYSMYPPEVLRRAKLREIMKFHFDQSMRKLEEKKK